MGLRFFTPISGTSTPPPPFVPSDLSGLVLWLDADNSGSITQAGGFVSQWDDLSVTAASFVQATGAIQPAYVASAIGGKPAVSFSGSVTGTLGCLIDTGANQFVGDGTAPFTVWAIAESGNEAYEIIASFFNATGPNNPQFFFASSDANYKFLSFGDSGGGAFTIKRSQTSFDSNAMAPYAITVTYDGSGNYVFYSANVSQTLAAAGAAGVNIAHTVLGANDPTGADPLLYLSEMAIYSRVLNSGELAQLQTYGHSKYGL